MLFLALQDWFYRFRPFTTFHALVAGICGVLIVAACWYGGTRHTPGSPQERRFRLAWGWSILACQAFATVWRLWPEHYTLHDGLPFQLCRIAGWVCGLSMVFGVRGNVEGEGGSEGGWRWARTATYFWGLGLCSQGIVTPLRLDGLSSMEFWLFWTVHLQIVGSAVYDVAVLRYRPALRDLGTAALLSLGYLAFIVPFNVIMNTDYGWLGRGLAVSKDMGWLGDGRYRTRNIIDHLGMWPERPVLLTLLGLSVMSMLWLVWQRPFKRLRAIFAVRPSSASGEQKREPLEAGAA